MFSVAHYQSPVLARCGRRTTKKEVDGLKVQCRTFAHKEISTVTDTDVTLQTRLCSGVMFRAKKEAFCTVCRNTPPCVPGPCSGHPGEAGALVLDQS